MVYDILEKPLRIEDQVDDSVPLVAIRFCDLHTTVDFHGAAAIGGRLYEYGREEELEPEYVMGGGSK